MKSGTIEELGDRIDANAAPAGVYLAISSSRITAQTSPSFVTIRHGIWDEPSHDYRFGTDYVQAKDVDDAYRDTEIGVGADGSVWALGCGSVSFAYVVAHPAATTSFDAHAARCRGAGVCDADVVPVAKQCFLEFGADPTVATAHVCAFAGCTSYIVSNSAGVATAVATDQPYSALYLRDSGMDEQNEIRTLLDLDDGVLVDIGDGPTRLLADRHVYAVAFDDDGGVRYAIAVVDDADGDGKKDVLVGTGPVGGDLTDVHVAPLAVDGVSYDAREVSVHVEDGRAVFAVTGDGDRGVVYDDIVAWSFYATPEP
jgi:hypothetical protein